MAIKRADQTTTAAPDESVLAETSGEETHAVSCVAPDSMTLGGFDGETGDVGMRLPYMQISHAQGKLEAFRKGSVVIGADNLIANPGDKLFVTLLAARVYWKEYVSGDRYDPSYIPKTFATKAEVIDAGGSTKWKDDVAPTYKIALATKALVQQPEGIVCGLFGVRIGEKDYAPVLWNMDKSAAARVAPIIKSDTTFSLRKRGLYSGIYELTTQSIKFPSGFSAHVPNIRLAGYHTDDEVAQILSIFQVDIHNAVDITE